MLFFEKLEKHEKITVRTTVRKRKYGKPVLEIREMWTE